jgi:hypothetical protein
MNPNRSLTFLLALVGALGILLNCSAAPAQTLSLAGTWRFQLDRNDVGVKERWFESPLELRIKLPDALQNQGFGDDIALDTKWTGGVGYGGDVSADRWLNGPEYAKYRQPGNIKVPFFLQPQKHYVGAAWYQRDIEIPAAWQGKRVVLTLERPHWDTRVWLDGKEFGTNNSLCAPHQFDLGNGLAAGKHILSIRVRNDSLSKVDVGSWAHSVTDHTQGNWNGIVGRIELSASSPVWIDDVQVYPNLAKKSALLRVRLGNASARAGTGTLTVSAQANGSRTFKVPVGWDKDGGRIETEIPLGDAAQAWDEFHPNLQNLSLHLKGDQADDRRSVTFGLRQFGVEGREFVLNGRKLFLRGTLECCIFPLTGYPPTDVASWKRLIGTCQAYGLNHIRFHSWCPPEAAFVAADELGFYLSVEVASWCTVGDGKPIDSWLYDEAARILKAYGNHPSFMLMAYGNEPAGSNNVAYLTKWVTHWKQTDPRRLYTSGSGYPVIPENQYHDYYNGEVPCRGLSGWLGKDYHQSVQSLTAPAIVHEMGQWCVYPNFDEMKKYTGPLKPRNFEIFRDSLTEHGMLAQAGQFVRASGKLQVQCYKEEIEAALRTPGIGGFHLLDLHDFPGQGTAPVGVLDPFWESKSYVTAKEYRRFCNTTVPLARLLKRVWTTSETLTAEVEVAHFGPEPLEHAVAGWKLVTREGETVVQGLLTNSMTVPLGEGTQLGRIELNLTSLLAPRAYKLVVSLAGGPSKALAFENDWNVWVYPAEAPTLEPGEVMVATSLDPQVLPRLQSGAKVLLLPAKLPHENPRLFFEPLFWCRYFFDAGFQTLGLLCDPKHPALARFPTDFYQDFQWQEIVTGARAMVLDSLPKDFRPIVQPIDDWNSNRKLGLVWECRVGQGKLVVCSADLQKDLDKHPAARQLRASLLAYMAGKEFHPKLQLGAEDLRRLFTSSHPSKLARLGAKVLEADSEDAHGNVAANVMDGDPDTIWHTRWESTKDPLPHHLTIDLGREITFQGLTYLPRQNMSTGRIAEAEVYCSADPNSWGSPVAKVTWPNSGQLQTLNFDHPVKARYLKLVARSEVSGAPFSSIAELDIVTDEK